MAEGGEFGMDQPDLDHDIDHDDDDDDDDEQEAQQNPAISAWHGFHPLPWW